MLMYLIPITDNEVRQKINTQYLTLKSWHYILKNCPLFKKKNPTQTRKIPFKSDTPSL